MINLCALILHSSGYHSPTFSLAQEPSDHLYVLFPSVLGSRSFLPTPPFSLLPARPAIVTQFHCTYICGNALQEEVDVVHTCLSHFVVKIVARSIDIWRNVPDNMPIHMPCKVEHFHK